MYLSEIVKKADLCAGQLARAPVMESQCESLLLRCQCLAKGGLGWVRGDSLVQLDPSQPSCKGLFTHCFPVLPFIDPAVCL